MKNKGIKIFKGNITAKNILIGDNSLVAENLIDNIRNGNKIKRMKSIVFISYNHMDKEIAIKISNRLKLAKIDVIIDRESMIAGDSINDFIENSIRITDVTVSLVSNKSLKSSWVAMETINTFFCQKFSSNKKFIGCFIDMDFFRPEFTLEVVCEIDAQIKKNFNLIKEHQNRMLDTREFNNLNSRLLTLRNNIDEIVHRLRECLCLDFSEPEFENSMKKLIIAIKK
jgi:hypothetical protein